MSNLKLSDFCQEALREAGLSRDLMMLIGMRYVFTCEHGSHEHTLCGTIQAVQVSDEGGVELHVSNPRFWGMPLTSIMRNGEFWSAYIAKGGDVEKPLWYPGELELFDPPRS